MQPALPRASDRIREVGGVEVAAGEFRASYPRAGQLDDCRGEPGQGQGDGAERVAGDVAREGRRGRLVLLQVVDADASRAPSSAGTGIS